MQDNSAHPRPEDWHGGGRPQAHETPGEAPPQPDGAPAGAASQDTLRRAEEMVDRVGERVGFYTAWLGRQLLWMAARAREEAEDVWAEAQSVRRGGRP